MTTNTDDCLFCRIVKGEIPCAKVYEDEYVFAFLDIAPFKEGHALLILKEHSNTVLDVNPDHMQYVLKAIQKIAPAVMEATNAQGFHVLQNNFAAAGQTVFHTHWHIIPRSEDDTLSLWAQGAYTDNGTMGAVAMAISQNIIQ